MFRGTGAIFSALAAYYNRVGLLTAINALTLLYSLPLVAVAFALAALTGQIVLAPVGAAFLLGVLPNPLAAGLQYCAHLVVRDEPVDLSDLRVGLRTYWKPASALFAAGLVQLVVILVNLVFYAPFSGPVFAVLDIVWLYLLATWLAMQLHIYPLLFAVESRSILLVYRNALVLAVTRPLPTLLVGAFWFLWLLFSAATGLILILGLILAALMQQALLTRLVPTYRAA